MWIFCVLVRFWHVEVRVLFVFSFYFLFESVKCCCSLDGFLRAVFVLVFVCFFVIAMVSEMSFLACMLIVGWISLISFLVFLWVFVL